MKLFILLLVAVALCAISTQAQSADDALLLQRDIFMTFTTTNIRLMSRTRQVAYRNRFEVEYRGTPTNQFSLQTRAWAEGDGTSTGFKFDLRFARIIEYFENDTIPGYSDGDTRTAPVYNIGDVTFTQDPNTTDSSGNIIYNFHGNTEETGTPVFTIRGYMVSVQTTVNGVVVIPSSHKFDLEIVPNWSVQPTSRLALVCFVDVSSSTGFHPKNATADEARASVSTVHLGDDATPAAAFGWVPNATANAANSGIQAPIIVSAFTAPKLAADTQPDPNQNRRQVAFSFDYPGATAVYWDPDVSIGTGSVSTDSGTGSNTASYTTASVVVLAGAALLSLVLA